MRRPEEGFTLLEVLAAVLIFAVWFTLIASAVTQGITREADGRNRLVASLIADRVLADLESESLVEVALSVDPESYGDDFYQVIVESQPFSLSGALGGSLPSGFDLEALAGGAAGGLVSEVTVIVFWGDEEDGNAVTRTTYTLDPAGLEALAGAVKEAAPPAPGSGDSNVEQGRPTVPQLPGGAS